jgi:hypothetical protein
MPTTVTVVLVSLLLATPAVIFWLWLVILPLRVAKLCPEECWCDDAGYFVDCSNKSLHNIPSIYLTQVQGLFLEYNNITSLEKDIFISKGLTELHFLALDRCGLQTIELGAFNGLTMLIYLSMPENGIEEITQHIFENMSGLEYLGLQYNKIEHLDVDVFSGLINLQHINLTGNELLKLHPDMFLELPKLERLDLGANSGLKIPTDRQFITSHSLKILNITFCNISSVSIETFANVSTLELLDLRYNNLRSIDINILKSLPKLSKMYLRENPLQCNCQMKELWRWCQDHNIWVDSYEADPECDSQTEGKRKWRWVLEELHCAQDNISNTDEYKQEHNKDSEDEDEQKYEQYKNTTEYVQVALNAILSIFGTTSNVIIIIIIICNKDMRTVSNMYILNLAVSDMIHLTSDIIANSVEFNHEFHCMFLLFCFRISVGLSAYSIAVLSIQRYRVTVNPLHVRLSSQSTWRATVATIFGVWILAALFAIPSALSKILCFGASRAKKNLTYYRRVVLFELLVSCVLPLCVIAFSYIMTAHHLVKRSRLISELTQNPQLNTRKNASKIVAGLTFVFLISYLPFHVSYTIYYCNIDWVFYQYNFESHSYLVKNLYFMHLISAFLLLINPCLNPIALFSTSRAFRRHFKRYLTCLRKANVPPTNIELARRN